MKSRVKSLIRTMTMSPDQDEDGPLQYEVECNLSRPTSPSLRRVIDCDSEHSNFVPVDSFGLSHLPDEIRCGEVMNLIKQNVDLTVKVSVKYVRRKDSVRPQNEQSKEKSERGEECEVTNEGCDTSGSGSVCYFSDMPKFDLCEHEEEDSCQVCHIPDCPYDATLGKNHFVVTNAGPSVNENDPERSHLAFRVSTNQHVIKDEAAAKNATVELFFHSEDKSGVVSAKVVGVCELWSEQDKVHIICVADLNPRVRYLLKTMRCSMRHGFESIPSDVRSEFIRNYVVVISHPHGTPKVISVGRKVECVNRKCTDGRRYTETRYLVETCLGSSGAPVVGPGWEDGGPGYRVHVGFTRKIQSQTKVGLSKSFWVVDSDDRGGAGPDSYGTLHLLATLGTVLKSVPHAASNLFTSAGAYILGFVFLTEAGIDSEF